MNLKTQHYLGACISVVVIAVIAAVLLFAGQRANHALDRDTLASEITIGLIELRSVTFEYVLHHHERPRVQWQRRHDSVARLLATDTFEGTDQQRIVNALRRNHQELKEIFTQLTRHYALGRNGGSDPAEIAQSRELEARLVGQLMVTSQEMVAATFRLMRESESEVAKTQRWLNLLLVLAVALMSFMVVASTVLTIRYFLKPLGRLERGMEIIGSGDLNYRTGITSANEIGALSQAFDRMATLLQESRASLEVERLRAARDQAVKESEARHRGIVESVMEGIISVDEQQRIVLFSHGAEQMFGRPAAAMIGEPLSLLVPERFRARHDEHIRGFAVTGLTNRPMGKYGLIYGLRASGEEFPVEATVSQSGTSPGKLLTVVLRDITERLRAEAVLGAYSERLRGLSRRLLETEESERRRLARELHDRIGQNVTTLNLNLNMLRGELPAEYMPKLKSRLDDCESLLYGTGQLVRDLMGDLRPPGLEELGLVPALHEHARQVAKRSGLSVTVRGTEVMPRLTQASEIVLFRIAQEALINVVKHASATEIVLTVEAGPDRVALTVADNGCGFDSRADPPAGHLGIVGMRERIESIGGSLRFASAPGAGTRVIAEAPRVVPADRASDTRLNVPV